MIRGMEPLRISEGDRRKIQGINTNDGEICVRVVANQLGGQRAAIV